MKKTYISPMMEVKTLTPGAMIAVSVEGGPTTDVNITVDNAADFDQDCRGSIWDTEW